MTMLRSATRCILGLCVLACTAGAVRAQSGGAFDLTHNVVAGGGATFSIGGAFALGGTGGQAGAGTVNGGAFVVRGGFWGGGPTSTPSASGHILYYSNSVPVRSVDVDLVNGASASTTTDANGMFGFASVGAGMLSLQPSKQGDTGTGVGALDAAYVLQYVAHLRTFSDDQKLAADVTGNGAVSALDAARILQYQAGLLRHCSVTTALACTTAANCPVGETCRSRFPVAEQCGSDWVFVPVPASAPNQTLVPPEISTGMCQTGAIDYSSVAPPASGQDFIAILFGDTTGNWAPQ